MKSRILSVILSVLLFSQISFAQLYSILKDVRVGEEHTLAVDDGNNLWACGGGGYARGLGNISETVLSLRRVLDGDVNTASGYLENVANFDAGLEHSLVVLSDGSCLSFGNDTFGQLGNGQDEGSSSVPIKVHGFNNDPNGLQNIVKVSAGRSGYHSLAVDNSGMIFSWGYNYYGQCGDGNNVNKLFPVIVHSTGTDPNFTYLGQEAFIIDVDAGRNHSLALASMEDGGIVFQWGQGIGSIPEKVPGENGAGLLSNIIDIATCEYSLAADSNGNVWYWRDSGNPTKVLSGEMGTTYLENIVKVAAGSSICAALDSSGNVWEWTAGASLPVKIADGQQNSSSGYLEDIIALDIGYYDQRIAIDSYGRGWGWGSNRGGALGIGNLNTPIEQPEMLCAENSTSVELVIEADANECVYPYNSIDDNLLTYNICYDANGFSDTNVIIIGRLQDTVDFNYASNDGVYDSYSKTVTWDIGNFTGSETGCLQLIVKANEKANPGGAITNICQIYSDNLAAYTTCDVNICCWSGNRIYIASDAAGYKNGTSWENAYNTFEEAFEAMERCGGYNEIWIKSGDYSLPATFDMPSGFKIYGGFAGWEEDPDQRTLDSNNLAIISGDNTGDGIGDLLYLMNLSDVNNIIIDGIEFAKSTSAGIYFENSPEPNTAIINCKFNENNYGCYLSYADPDITNCIFLNNSDAGLYSAYFAYPVISKCSFSGNDYGVNCTNGFAQISQSEFSENITYGAYFNSSWSEVIDSFIHDNSTGIYCEESSDVIIENCCVIDNSVYGVHAFDARPEIYDSVVTGNYDGVRIESGSTIEIYTSLIAENIEYGIYAGNSCAPEIYNSIIKDNQSDGIYCTDTGQIIIKNNWILNNGDSTGYGINLNAVAPGTTIQNNTICRNLSGGVYRTGGIDPNIRNCIFWDNASNDLSGTFGKITYCRLSSYHSGTGNITSDPCFVAPDSNNYHLNWQSLCIDAGFTLSSQNYETDIDGEARIFDGDYDTIAKVDMGADECYQSPADINIDDVVNFIDYAIFANAWRSQTGGGNWNADCDLEVDGVIDYKDLAKFTGDWLWQAQQSTSDLLEHECQELAQSNWPEIGGEMMMSVPPQSSGIELFSSESLAMESVEAIEYVEPFDVNETLDWLDDLWTSGELTGSMTEAEFEEFRQAIANYEE